MVAQQFTLQVSNFSLDQCLVYLNRNTQEFLHRVREDAFIKAIPTSQGIVVIEMKQVDGNLQVNAWQTDGALNQDEVEVYLKEMFDMNRDLVPFRTQFTGDDLLEPIIHQFWGLRMIRVPDLFEVLCWSIIGQQINLNFAYTLKKRLVEAFGKQVNYQGLDMYLFPTAEQIAKVKPETLKAMKFNRQKVEYILGIAQLMTEGDLSKEGLIALGTPAAMREELIKIRGIGNWTANYVMMKGLGIPSALPIEDVGLHNALKNQLKQDHKPTISAIREMAKTWEGWEAYVTFYLWQTLLTAEY